MQHICLECLDVALQYVQNCVRSSSAGLEESMLLVGTIQGHCKMSDARAKAEARRAKILARDSSKKVQAIGDDVRNSEHKKRLII